MKPKGVTTQMKALDEYFLVVVFKLLLNRVHVYADLCLIWTQKRGCERIKSANHLMRSLKSRNKTIKGYDEQCHKKKNSRLLTETFAPRSNSFEAVPPLNDRQQIMRTYCQKAPADYSGFPNDNKNNKRTLNCGWLNFSGHKGRASFNLFYVY